MIIINRLPKLNGRETRTVRRELCIITNGVISKEKSNHVMAVFKTIDAGSDIANLNLARILCQTIQEILCLVAK